MHLWSTIPKVIQTLRSSTFRLEVVAVFPHSRLELAAGAGGTAGPADDAAGEDAAAPLGLARGDTTPGVARGELSQPLFGEGTGGVAARAPGEAAEEADAFPGLSADAGAAGAAGAGGTGGAGGATGGGSSASWVSPSCSNTSDAATMVHGKEPLPSRPLGARPRCHHTAGWLPAATVSKSRRTLKWIHSQREQNLSPGGPHMRIFFGVNHAI